MSHLHGDTPQAMVVCGCGEGHWVYWGDEDTELSCICGRSYIVRHDEDWDDYHGEMVDLWRVEEQFKE